MIVFAVNVHTGGGAVLLEELLANNTFGIPIHQLYVDSRFTDRYGILKAQHNIKVNKINPNVFSRIYAEIKMYHQILSTRKATSPILFFGNIPPFFRFYLNILCKIQKIDRPEIWLFFQNALLFDTVKLDTKSFSFKLTLKLLINKKLVHLFYKNIDKMLVQNQWMLNKSTEEFKEVPIEIKPIPPYFPLTKSQIVELSNNANRPYHIIYVGSLLPHKNLNLFLKAIESLVTTDFTYTIAIVLDLKETDIPQEFLKYKSFKNIKVDFYCQIERMSLFNLYSQSKYMVCTSSYESYYIPMYEAHSFGCKVIAPSWAGYAEHVDFINSYYSELIPPLHQIISTDKIIKTL